MYPISHFVRFSLYENWLLTAEQFKKCQRYRWIKTFSTSNRREDSHGRTVISFVYVRCSRSRWKCMDPFICRQMTTTGKIANNGLALHHRNVGYVAKRAKICILEKRRCGWIEHRDAFLWMTQHFNGASKRTKFGVILGRRHNEYAISSITGLHRRSSFFPYFSHTRASKRILERIFRTKRTGWIDESNGIGIISSKILKWTFEQNL